jgi:tRNA 2-thiouridine synthesizing protein A
MPIVRLNNAIKAVAVGELVAFEADDPAFVLDVQAWSRRTGHDLVGLDSVDGHHRGAVRRAR